MVPFFQVDQLATWLQIDYIVLLPLWKEQYFLLTGLDTVDMTLPSVHAVIWQKLPSLDLQDALCTLMLFYIALLLIRN